MYFLLSIGYTFILVLWCFFNDTATTAIYTYIHTRPLHDALPIGGSSAAAPKWPLPSLCIGADSAPILAKYRHSGATGEKRSICCRFWRRVAVVMPLGYPESTDTSIRMLAA